MNRLLLDFVISCILVYYLFRQLYVQSCFIGASPFFPEMIPNSITAILHTTMPRKMLYMILAHIEGAAGTELWSPSHNPAAD